MGAIAKIDALGVPELARRTGRPASIIYRWRRALQDGRGIRDANKRQLIEATRGHAQALTWQDFVPEGAAA